MSEIFVDTIKNKAGSTSLDSDKLPDMYSGSVKAWIDHSNTAVVNDSFNVSSLTDNTTGNHTPTLTNSFSAANSYAVSVQAMDTSAGNGYGVHSSIYTNGKLAGSWRHSQYGWTGAWQDANMYALAVGDLA